MKLSIVGLFAGLLLALTLAVGGLLAFLGALILGTVGFLLGAQADGDLDLGALVRNNRRE